MLSKPASLIVYSKSLYQSISESMKFEILAGKINLFFCRMSRLKRIKSYI